MNLIAPAYQVGASVVRYNKEKLYSTSEQQIQTWWSGILKWNQELWEKWHIL